MLHYHVLLGSASEYLIEALPFQAIQPGISAPHNPSHSLVLMDNAHGGAIHHSASTLWNSLPTHLRLATSFGHFKNHLKTYICLLLNGVLLYVFKDSLIIFADSFDLHLNVVLFSCIAILG